MSTAPQPFPKTARLLQASQFSHVFSHNNRRASSRHALILGFSAEGQTHSRLGLVIAKKNVRLASQRNRIKRLVREYFRRNTPDMPTDIVFLARRGLAELSNQQIQTLLQDLWRKLASP